MGMKKMISRCGMVAGISLAALVGLAGCGLGEVPVVEENQPREKIAQDAGEAAAPSAESPAVPENAAATESPLVAESPSNPELRHLSGAQATVVVNGASYLVDLYDNPTADDLLARLPLSLTADTYPGYDERVLRLDEPLSMEGAPEGDDPAYPELGFYEPGNWIAIYYGHIGYFAGKVPLGQIHATVDELASIPDGSPLTIEPVGK